MEGGHKALGDFALAKIAAETVRAATAAGYARQASGATRAR